MSLTVAISGRPNVGKSTLFNRLVGRRQAMVDDRPGVTRDRREGEGTLMGTPLRVIDAAGWEEKSAGGMEEAMHRQSERAMREADAVFFLIDARVGVTPPDRALADLLRRLGRPVVLVANKCEGRAAAPGLLEAHELGMGDPVPLSAEHGEGLSDLRDALLACLGLTAKGRVRGEKAPAARRRNRTADDAYPGDAENAENEENEDAGPIRLAILGRPNVGKSTLINRLIGDDRLLTGPEAGMTRESIALDWNWRGHAITLVDTAGLRRRARIEDRVEKLSAADSMRTLRFAQVVALVLDARDLLEKQDLTLARLIAREGRAPVIVVNKWDLIQDGPAALAELRRRLQLSLPQLRDVPVVTLSALRGRGLDKLPEAVLESHRIWTRRIPTARLNQWLATATTAHPPPLAPSGRRIKLRYMTQIKARPPTFVLFASVPEGVPESYRRYLTNGLRTAFDLPGAPVRLQLRRGENPYAPKR